MMMAPLGSHVPVLIDVLIERVAPVSGVWLDGTFGAGGYARALLAAGATRVIGVDRDPAALAAARTLAEATSGRLILRSGRFADLDTIARECGVESLAGIALDIGVSSIQIDQAERGFSFQKDGPLDMRMERNGRSAADIVNGATERELAEILFQFGEERAARRVARAIVAERSVAPIETTGRLAGAIRAALPSRRPGEPDPATRSFQALRIAVNDELGQLVRGLFAAERALAPGGALAVVTFHSLEDRIVKRFLQDATGRSARASRHAPDGDRTEPRFDMVTSGAMSAGPEEIALNPRARSARLRIARRRAAPPRELDSRGLGLPALAMRELQG